MTYLHRVVAYSIPAGFALLALWALAAWIFNREPHRWFWALLAGVQVILGVQVVVGAVLFAVGERPATSGPEWLHYLYGGLFPVIVLVLAHRWARRAESLAWVLFGAAGLVNFGLTFRALQTGLGIG